jgi:hypothetical protein
VGHANKVKMHLKKTPVFFSAKSSQRFHVAKIQTMVIVNKIPVTTTVFSAISSRRYHVKAV